MHSENAKNLLLPPPASVDPPPDVPQAVAAKAQPIIAAVNRARRHGRDGWIARTRSVVADRA
jgi:hypothetical protein